MEQRPRSWSAARLKARVWTGLLCLRLVKFSVIVSILLFFFLYLQVFINQYQHEWKPRKFLHLRHMMIEVGGVESKNLARSVHVCMDMYQGGLGNRMFQYAAVYVSSSKFNKSVMMSTKDALKLPFYTSAKPSFFFRCKGQVLAERLPCAYDERLLQKSPENQNVVLHGYWQSWKYFRHFDLDLRREFKFKEKIVTNTEIFLERLRNFTLIGIHIRRGDMLEDNYRNYGYQLPPPGYFHTAMSWFRKRFSDAVFVVCSNDMRYSKSILGGEKDVFFSEHHTPAEDLSILASCRHTIMSVGTFGWWGGWLAGGQVIYYKNYARKGSAFEKDIVAEDFFPPTWIGME